MVRKWNERHNEFKNGEKHGLTILWHVNGQKWAEMNYQMENSMVYQQIGMRLEKSKKNLIQKENGMVLEYGG